jgi:hypothetical protein
MIHLSLNQISIRENSNPLQYLTYKQLKAEFLLGQFPLNIIYFSATSNERNSGKLNLTGLFNLPKNNSTYNKKRS